jgi:hypothetical protein
MAHRTILGFTVFLRRLQICVRRWRRDCLSGVIPETDRATTGTVCKMPRVIHAK